MRLIFFFLRLLALPVLLAFFLVGGVLYIIGMGFAWLLTGDQINIWLKYPDWK
jgi:hypothetical protein